MMHQRRHARGVGLLIVLAGLVVAVGGAAAEPNAPAAATSTLANAGWEEVGGGSATGSGISNTSGRSDSPVHAITPGGAPVVAWDDDRGDGEEIYVRTWNGSTWAEIGGSASGGGVSTTPGASTSPAVAVAADGAPIVAWEVSAGADYEIYLRRWNGSTWVEMGGSASGGGISNNTGGSYGPAVLIGSDGAPVVAWFDASGGDWEIYVKRWNGSSWVEMGSGAAAAGGISNNSGASRLPALVVGPGGAPVIVWEDDSGGDWEIYARQWNGSAWAEMGSGSASGDGVSNNSGTSIKPRLAAGPDGNPLVTWEDNSDGDAEIYVRRWNGSAWVEMGSGSAAGGGISNNGGASSAPVPAIGPDGTTLIAWHDNSGTNYEAYVRRWNGSAWVEIDAGSASGGGISNNAGNSYSPAPVIAPDGRAFIVWADATSGNYEIYARSNPPVATTCYTLAVNVTGSGSVSVAPQKTCYNGGEQVTLTATPGGGYVFSGWSGDLSGNTNPATLTMSGNKSVTATFAVVPPCYTLSRSHTGSGSDPTASPANSPGCGAGQYTAGQSITLSATPTAGWQVSGWSGTSNNSSKETTNALVMPAQNHVVSVAYEQKPIPCYTLGRSHTGSGSDPFATPANSPGCSAGQYTAGQAITLSAAPLSGWRVAGWTGTASDNSESTSNALVMPAKNHAVSVAYVFEPPPCYPLALSHAGNGADPGAEPASSDSCAAGRYTAGEVVNVTAVPAANWRVKNWSGTSNDASQTTTNSFIMPEGAHAVSVTYETIPVKCYPLALTHTGSGSNPTASPSNSTGCTAGRYVASQDITLTAGPASGWRVRNWSGTANNGSTATTNSLTMPEANHTASVAYELVPVVEMRLAYTPLVLYQPAPPPVCFPGPDESEPNNMAAAADGPLCNGATYKGRPNDEYDIFYIDLKRPGDVAVTMSNHPRANVQLALHYQVISNNALDVDANGSDGFSVGNTNGQAGRYFIVIYVPEGNTGGSAQYSLRVTFTE